VAVEELTSELGPDDIGIVMRPLYYSGPFVTILSALYSGGAIVVMAKFEAPAFFQSLRKFGITWYSGGPVFQRAIYAHGIAHPEDAAGIRFRQIRVETAALDPEIADGLERLFSTCISTSYGSTESGRIALTCPSIGLRKVGTVGFSVERLGFQGSEVRIRSLEGQFLPVGERGEIVVRGPQVFEGYENDEAASAAAFVDGWFQTGDEGFFDADGYLTLTGRIKEMISRGGEKVSPAEVDAALMEHPGVREAATFPIPHPTLGEEVAAAVVQEAGAGLTDQVLTKDLLQKLSGFKVPRRFFFVDDIPKTEAGKIQRYRLAAALGVAEGAAAGAPPGGAPDRPPTPLEARLQALWAKALRLPRVGLHDNFFLLGGDSLQAVELFLMIEQELKSHQPVAALFEAGTVAEMAKLIEDRVPQGCVVPIQPHGDKPPFFCVHGARGGVIHFSTLARHLGGDQPFYGIQSVGWDPATPPFTRTVDMVAHYVSEMRKIQPHGPYFLGGYSFGGRVAVYMAKLLKEAGEEVALLAIVDSTSFIGRKYVCFGQWMARMGVPPGPGRMGFALRYARFRIYRAWRGFLVWGCRLVLIPLGELYRASGRPVPFFLFRPDRFNALLRVEHQNIPAYEGDAVYFRTTIEPHSMAHADTKESWDRVIRGRLEAVPLAGNHEQILQDSHVGPLAEELRRFLAKAQARSLD
jgi:thioesterase domain-containing protein/acyl carrier protein